MIKYIVILLLFIFNTFCAKECCYEGSQTLSSALCQYESSSEIFSYVVIGNSTYSPCPKSYGTVDFNYSTMEDGGFEWYQCKNKNTGYEYYQVGGCRGIEIESKKLKFSNNQRYFYLSSCIFTNANTVYSSVSGSSLQVIGDTLSQYKQICIQTGGTYFTYTSWEFGNSVDCQSSNGQCQCPSNYNPASCI